MFCTKCGAQLRDDARFCTACGQPVSSRAVQRPAAEMPQPAPQPVDLPEPAPRNEAVKKKFPVVPVVCAAVALIAAGVAAVILLHPKDNTLTPEDKPIVISELQPIEASDDEPEEESREEAEIAFVSAFAPDSTEYRIQQDIQRLNAESFSEASIDVYADNYAPGPRDATATWDQRIFYVLEGYQTDAEYVSKYDCALQKKELRNSVTGNIMEYELYMNPANNKPNKIVSIEYLPDGLEVMEYYFTNEGKISFIFQYRTDNYVSTYATPDKSGDRFLFNNDSLVTWRSITPDAKYNYILGSAEAERMKPSWAASTMRYYDELDTSMRDAFDQNERDMINAAYNTYNIVLGSPGIVRIRGYVYDADGSGVNDADVALYDESFDAPLYTTQTSGDGMYTIYVPDELYTYNLRVGKTGLSDCDIYAVRVNNEQIGSYQDGAYLFDAGAADADVSLILGDAFEYASYGGGMQRLSNATVNVRSGINNRAGAIETSTTCDSSGFASLRLAPGLYTIEVLASGYETMYYSIVANPSRENLYEFYAAPTLPEGEYAIVLTWGATPSDLDSHLFTTAGTASDHIWYGRQSDSNNSYLDVDDTSSYGPETVTIRSFSTDKYYKYCVVDFSNCSGGHYSSYDMSLSGARINVYSSDGLIATFPVPTNQPGVIWEVFEIRHGAITPIQRYYNTVENMDWWHSDK